jgi:hypothetical protein
MNKRGEKSGTRNFLKNFAGGTKLDVEDSLYKFFWVSFILLWGIFYLFLFYLVFFLSYYFFGDSIESLEERACLDDPYDDFMNNKFVLNSGICNGLFTSDNYEKCDSFEERGDFCKYVFSTTSGDRSFCEKIEDVNMRNRCFLEQGLMFGIDLGGDGMYEEGFFGGSP